MLGKDGVDFLSHIEDSLVLLLWLRHVSIFTRCLVTVQPMDITDPVTHGRINGVKAFSSTS